MVEVIDLCGDRLEVASPDHVRVAAKVALDQGETHYTTRPGIIPLRQAIANDYSARTGVTADPVRQVLVTCGEEEALFVAIHTLVATGDEVLVIGPSPQSDDDVVRQAGGTIRHVPWPDQDSSSDAWLGSAISNRTRAVLLRTPSLTGVSLFDGSARAVLAKVQAHNSTVISVEGLSDFGWHGYRHRGFAATADAHRRTVTIGDFSAWGLDGWRVGYLLGPAPLVAPMTNFKQALSICSPALGQYAALAAATGPQTHLDDLRSDLESRSQAIAGELERFGIPIPAVEAGFHLFLPTNAVRGDPTPDILSAASVRVAAGDDFRVPGTIRITLSQPPPVLVEAVRRIAPWLSGTGEGTRRG